MVNRTRIKSRRKDVHTARIGHSYRRPSEPGVPRHGEPSEESELRQNFENRRNRPPITGRKPKPKPKKGSKKTSSLITLNGSIFTDDSFSVVTRGLASGLLQNGYKVAIDAWTEGNRSHPIEPEVRAATKISSDDKIGIRISHPNSFDVLTCYDYKIGKAYFETNVFPHAPGHDWVKMCNTYCDQVWASSRFNKQTCEKSGTENVFIVHDGFDPRIFSPQGKKLKLPFDDDVFVFLTVGNSQERKGTDMLYKAFTEEFCNGEKVGLVYKSYAGWAWGACKYDARCFEPGVAERHKIKAINDPRIYHYGKCSEWLDPKDNKWKPKLTESSIPYNDIGSLYRAADCFVLPTYGEGAGICNLEAMACGVPVITTNWSAHLDYCDNTNSYLIEGLRFEDAFHKEGWEGQWIIPSIDQLKFYLRYVYERPEMVKLKVKQALDDAQDFTWKNCAQEAIRAIMIGVPEFVDDVDFEVLSL